MKWFFVAVIWLGVVGAGATAYFAYDLPAIETLAGPPRNPAVQVLASNGIPIASYGDLSGDFVALQEIPAVLVQAVLATEDRRFYRHFGVDLWGIVRASVANLRAGRIVEGASTITQQLAKITFLTPERTIRRKVQEVLLAFWLERRFTKDEILTIYLNRVYLGAGTYGVDAAARRYFGRSVREVSLAQAAMLAGLLKAPSRYAPTRHLALAQERAEAVLAAMVDTGALSLEEARSAVLAPATLLAARVSGPGARYFADWVLEQVPDYVGPGRGDLIVVTTLDLALQRAAERAVEEALAREGDKLSAHQAALVALGPSGAVRAMVGGRDYSKSQFNRATQAARQPGSAFKLVLYLAGLEAGYAPDDMMLDAPLTIGDWSPDNYDGRYLGEISLEEAFVRSINTVAVRLGQAVGVERVIKMARKLGITAELPAEATLALGSGGLPLIELAQAYAALAAGGERVLAHGITEILSAGGEVLYRREGSGTGPVISKRAAQDMSRMLAAAVERGTGHAASLPEGLGPVFGKTGTSQDFRDAWFMGFAGGLVTGVWVGNDDARPMNRVSGGGLPARLWRDFMTEALSCLPAYFHRGCSWLARAEP